MNWKQVYSDGTIKLRVRKFPPAWDLWARPAATCIPVTKSGQILIMDERKGTKKNRWGFPGGMIEKGETAKQAAQRECEEEIGLRPSRLKLIEVVQSGFPDTSVSFFLGYNLKEGVAVHWEAEPIDEVQEVPFSTVMKMVDEGQFHDPRTVVALLALNRLIKQGKVVL